MYVNTEGTNFVIVTRSEKEYRYLTSRCQREHTLNTEIKSFQMAGKNVKTDYQVLSASQSLCDDLHYTLYSGLEE